MSFLNKVFREILKIKPFFQSLGRFRLGVGVSFSADTPVTGASRFSVHVAPFRLPTYRAAHTVMNILFLFLAGSLLSYFLNGSLVITVVSVYSLLCRTA